MDKRSEFGVVYAGAISLPFDTIDQMTDQDELVAMRSRFAAYPNDRYCRLATELVDERIEQLQVRKAALTARRRIASEHEHLFVRIGRRDGFKCSRCGGTDDLQIDHRSPLSRGGTNDLSNLQLLCAPCNLEKGNRTMEEWLRHE